MTENLNAPFPADEAGDNLEALERILDRIPEECGKWISCDKGWFPLLAHTDAKIGILAPEYEIRQVKEKFGTLRFYWNWPELRPACCIELDSTDPRPDNRPVSAAAAPGRTPEQQEAMEAWLVRRDAHQAGAVHTQCNLGLAGERDRRAQLTKLIRQIVINAENESARTCQSCGQEGTLVERNHWLNTLCQDCAADGGWDAIRDEHDQ